MLKSARKCGEKKKEERERMGRKRISEAGEECEGEFGLREG